MRGCAVTPECYDRSGCAYRAGVDLTIRDRRPDDLPALEQLLGAQQSTSGYPHRWPLPFPIEEFLVRPGQLGAWVAEVDGVVAGHVAATDPAGNWMADEWRRITGRPGEELGEVSILFVGLDHGGVGIGGALLDHAVAVIRSLGREPVLDVVDEFSSAGQFYRRRGWTTIGYGRPPWLEDELPPVAYLVLSAEATSARKRSTQASQAE